MKALAFQLLELLESTVVSRFLVSTANLHLYNAGEEEKREETDEERGQRIASQWISGNSESTGGDTEVRRCRLTSG